MRVVALASGSTGNCTLVQSAGCALLIDAGISARRVRTMLRNEGTELSDLAAILITHDHYDHFSPDDIAKVAGPNTVLVVPEKMKSKAGKAAGKSAGKNV